MAGPGRITPLTCWTCGERLRLSRDGLGCRNGHPVPEAADGVYDLWPPDREPPGLDVYGTPIGWAYDENHKPRLQDVETHERVFIAHEAKVTLTPTVNRWVTGQGRDYVVATGKYDRPDLGHATVGDLKAYVKWNDPNDRAHDWSELK